MARHARLFIKATFPSTGVVMLSLFKKEDCEKHNRVDVKYARAKRDLSEIVHNWQYKDFPTTKNWSCVGMDAADTEHCVDTVERFCHNKLEDLELFT